MNKRGFTLVELIVTIALLGMITGIAFVSINGIMEESRVQDCKDLLNNIKSATKEYVSDNRYNSSFVNVVNNKNVSINADTLINGNYLTKEIVNPFDTDEVINGNRVNIKITLKDNYTVNNIDILIDGNDFVCEKDNWT